MEEKWYFVEDGEKKGPFAKIDIGKYIEIGRISGDSYLWKKGFSDWKKLKDIEGLQNIKEEDALIGERTQPFLKMPELSDSPKALTFDKIDPNARQIFIKTGLDRGTIAQEFGPFNLPMLQKLYKGKRINARTLVFFPGLDVWRILGSFEDFEKIFQDKAPIIDEQNRRDWERKPFTARLFFTNEDQFFEGMCRDISMGGMKVLINNFPCELGDEISLNVHPEEESHQFVAKARVVRILDNNGGFSLQFIDLDDKAKRAISSYLARN